MPALIDARPPGVDVEFRPGQTLTLTLNWPAGALAGRTFTSTLDGVALGVNIVGDLMTITATVAQTAAVVGIVEWLLTETTGDDQPIMVGKWSPSTRASAVSSQTVQASQGAVQVSVAVAAVNASVATLTVAGTATFAQSPLVPNPAAPNPLAAASVGEVEALIAEASAGFVSSMDPKTTLNPAVVNTTTETSLLNATFSMPKPTHEMVGKVTAFGICRNISAGATTFTFRVRNTTDATIVWSAVVTLPNDASGTRAWRLTVDFEDNVFLAGSLMAAGELVVGPGSTDGFQRGMGQAVTAEGTDPQTWDVTAQLQNANANTSVTCYGAKVEYALPGA